MGDLGPANGHAGFSAYKVRQHLAASLRRLQTDRVDLYQVHHIDEQVSAEELWGTFEHVVGDGDVLYAGASNHSGWGLAKRQMQAWQRGFLGFVSEQTQYNLLSRVPEMEGVACGAGLRYRGAGLHATGRRSADRQDCLVRRDADPPGRGGVRDPDRPGNRQFAAFGELCRGIGEPERIVATAWVLQHSAVVSAIVGVRTVDQLSGLDRAAALHLDVGAMARLDEIFNINDGRRIGSGQSPEAHSW